MYKVFVDARCAQRQVTHTESVVELVLDKNTAITLLSLTGKVGGEPQTTYRVHTDAIRAALLRLMPEYGDAAAGLAPARFGWTVASVVASPLGHPARPEGIRFGPDPDAACGEPYPPEGLPG